MPKSMKINMFSGQSFLRGFWKDFGKVLESQKPRFSQFFPCFFEANFDNRCGERKVDNYWRPRGGGDSNKRTTFRAGPSYARIFNILRILGAQNQHSTRPEAFGLGGFQLNFVWQ